MKQRLRLVFSGLILLASSALLASADAANGSVVYSYDALGRLVLARYDTGVCIAYSYDSVGNRTAEKVVVTGSGGTGVWGCFNWNGAQWGS